jgi:hypothetical protein
LLIPPHAALISKQRAAIESSQGECGLKNTGKTGVASDAAYWLSSPPQAYA